MGDGDGLCFPLSIAKKASADDNDGIIDVEVFTSLFDDEYTKGEGGSHLLQKNDQLDDHNTSEKKKEMELLSRTGKTENDIIDKIGVEFVEREKGRNRG